MFVAGTRLAPGKRTGCAALRAMGLSQTTRWSCDHRVLNRAQRSSLAAARDAPAPPRQPGQRGRPRVQGARLPTLAARSADLATAWTAATVANWYGHGPRTVAGAPDTAVC